MNVQSDTRKPLDPEAISQFAARFSIWAESLPEADQHLLRIMLQRGQTMGGDTDVAAYGMGAPLRALILAALVAANAAAGAGLAAPGHAAAFGIPPITNPTIPTIPVPQPTVSAPHELTALLPDLTVSLSGPQEVGIGDFFNYTVRLKNVGGSPAAHVAIDVNVGPGVTLASSSAQPSDRAFSCSQSGQVVHCMGAIDELLAIPPLDNSQDIVLSLRAPMQTGTLNLSAVVNPGNTINESSTTNNSASATTNVVARPDIQVSLIHGYTGQRVDQVLPYEFMLTNASDVPASAVFAQLTITGNGEISDFEDPGAGLSCRLPDGQGRQILSCVGGALAARASVPVKVSVKAHGPAGGTMNLHFNGGDTLEAQKFTGSALGLDVKID